MSDFAFRGAPKTRPGESSKSIINGSYCKACNDTDTEHFHTNSLYHLFNLLRQGKHEDEHHPFPYLHLQSRFQVQDVLHPPRSL